MSILALVASTSAQKPTSQIYVVDADNDRIVRMDEMTGTGWKTYGTLGEGIHNFFAPNGIAVTEDGRVYVADSGNDRIVQIDNFSGAGWIAIGQRGRGKKEFIYPLGISVAPSGQIFVADSGNRRVVRLKDITGTGWVSFAESREAESPDFPKAIFAISSGTTPRCWNEG